MDSEKYAKEFMEQMFYMKNKHKRRHLSEMMHGENMVLLFISQNSGQVMPGQICTEFGITSARVAAVLKSLEKKGMISRNVDEQDRRKTRISITDAGLWEVELQHQRIFENSKKMMEILGEKDAQNLIRILDKITKSEI